MIGAVGSSFCPENTQIEFAWAGPCVGLPLPVISPAKAGAGIARQATTIAAAVSHFLMRAPLLKNFLGFGSLTALAGRWQQCGRWLAARRGSVVIPTGRAGSRRR